LNKTLVNTNFTTTTKVDQEGNLKALFFCHTDSLKLLKEYHHIILLDCTYKKNKYYMPLLHVSGITVLNKTFSVAFCFMAEETNPFYNWALQCNHFSPYSKATRSPSLPLSSLIVSRL
jgi:hypothetical protein